MIWWTGSVEVVVATLSTIIYQYSNTAVTSYRTIIVNATKYPTENIDSTVISGIPTDLVGNNHGGYPQLTSFVYGTQYTDSYGAIYQSPTNVWNFGDVTYYTQLPITTGAAYECPSAKDMANNEGQQIIKAYPSGFSLAGNGSIYGNGECKLI